MYYAWQIRQAKTFLTSCEIDTDKIIIGCMRKTKQRIFVLRIDDDLLFAETVAKIMYDRHATVMQCNHGRKSSWIRFMIPAQARAWNSYNFIVRADYYPKFIDNRK